MIVRLPGRPRAGSAGRLRTALTVSASIAVTVAVAPLVTPVSGAYAAPDAPLSQGKPATASSETGPAHVATAAVDGDAGTRWRSERRELQWISVDLGAMSTIDRVSLHWPYACARAYRVQTSPEGVQWNTVYATTAGRGGTEDLTVTGFGRFVRVYATQPCRPSAGYSLAEFQVYGSAGVIDTQPPTAPVDLRSTAVTATTASLAWGAATDNVVVKAYDIYQLGQLVKSVDGTTLATSISRLKPLTSYGFYINARDDAGNVSQASDTVDVTTPAAVIDNQPPTAPANVRVAAVTANSVSLEWDPSTDDVGVVGYTVFSGTTQVATATTDAAVVSGLAPRADYTFTVTAADAARHISQPGGPVTATTTRGRDPVGQVTRIAADTDVPWGLAFLPDGSALMTERDTHDVVHVTATGQKTTVGTVPGVSGTDGEGGLLGLAVSPCFASDHWLYIFHTAAADNRIVRIRYEHGSLDLASEQVLLSGIARNKFHDGGRLRFGPDGKLYASTGDGQNGANAQNLNSLNGKVLRLNPDGSVPRDNPFPGKYVWSYGHRNIEGLAFDSKGRLWEAELGNSITDELNVIQKGGNYGWPACEGTAGSCEEPTFIPPVQTWPVADASPSGLAIVDDTLYMAALRGTRLWRMKITGRTTTPPQPYFTGAYGRLRTVEPSPDGGLWMTTSNGGDKDSVPDNSNTLILHLALHGRR
jgi:glucose/arabinose dehydrogenase